MNIHDYYATSKSDQLLNWWDGIVRNDMQAALDEIMGYVPERDSYIIVDVGANCGVWTEEMLKRVNVDKALLFEPIKTYADYAARKFGTNDKIIVENFALSDVEEQQVIYCGGQPAGGQGHNLGWNTIIAEKTNEENGENPVDIECKVFDDLNKSIYKLDRIDIMKIDTEGYEYKIFNGMLETLASLEHKPVIVCEIAWGMQHPYLKELEEVLWKIGEIGYLYEQIDFDGTRDVFLLPKDGKNNLDWVEKV